MTKKFVPAVKLRVRYSETDQMKIVYNANYLDWFEVARTELCRSWGKPYTEWEKENLMLPVVEAWCRYKHPARYDDEIEVQARVSELNIFSITFEYRVIRLNDGLLLAEGRTKHGCTDSKGQLYRKEHPFYLWVKAVSPPEEMQS